MFWFKKKTQAKAQMSREKVIEQAKAVAKAKTQEIGDDRLSEIRAALLKRENSVLEQAKQKIMRMDDDKLRDNLKYMLHDKE